MPPDSFPNKSRNAFTSGYACCPFTLNESPGGEFRRPRRQVAQPPSVVREPTRELRPRLKLFGEPAGEVCKWLTPFCKSLTAIRGSFPAIRGSFSAGSNPFTAVHGRARELRETVV